MREHRLRRRVVEVDLLVVLHVELDQAERVFRPQLLHAMAVFLNEIVLASQAWPLSAISFAAMP